ncbi:WD domain-containing protein, G-beta repeat-containing protein [Lentzea waywayandensis]|uniref:WD domain-containing protein, G-beta repeat-containing protein n=2 Tax=Lentzea waywayandensis TaxID=84724 RepID=A0A1I6F3D2_9PSEU|nr:WD domain-containing protein, G-beta repeat-containing protein [Lentzea waywayandensis]
MALDRVIEFGEPITRLAVNTDIAADPLLEVHGHRGRAVVHANTGVRYEGEHRIDWRPATDNLAGFSRPDGLQVRVDGKDVLIRTTGDTGEWRTLSGHTTPITAVTTCPTPGGPLVVSASVGGTIRLWDPRSGEQLRIGAPGGRVDHVVSIVGPDGRPRIVSGDDDGNVQIWNPRLPPVPRIGPVSTRGFSDRVAQEDLLDRGTLVEALRDVLRPGDDDGPTVITVEGAWGSGKSTLLELVKNRLPTPPTATRPRRRFTVSQADRMLYRPPAGTEPPEQKPTKIKPMIHPLVVSFNPWRHQSSEQVWAGLAKAVTEAAESAIMPHQNNRERYWFARNAGRVDRRHLQRQLWRRIFSPLLSFAGLGFGLSVLGALTKINLGWAWWATAGLAAAGVVHTGLRYLFGKASAFLPGELFAGPVVSNAFSATTTDSLIRDPYYNARSGYLYLVQHDIRALLRDLETHRHRLILLIDDLDRCTPRTTAQVFEAINVFLSDDFPATRFVLGLDTAVVASHVDHAYKELADAKIVTHPDDPSPGWTFLRKLVQLPVRLPRTTEDNVDRILLAQLGPVHREEPHADAEVPVEPVITAEAAVIPGTATVEQVVVAIEQHAEVREHLRHRLKAQPEQSVREEKRLLNVWQFYLRVLVSEDVRQASHLVAVAEIATRWPAYLHRLRGGWQELADALDDDVQWGATIARLGFTYSDRKAAVNLRDLLRDCDAQAVARLATRLF